MDKTDCDKASNGKYVEAETVSEDSEISSLSNFTDGTTEVNPFLEGINKVKGLIQELEESFRECNNISNNLILRCVLLRAENQNLVHQIDQKRSATPQTFGNRWKFSLLCENNEVLKGSSSEEEEHKKSVPVNSFDNGVQGSFVYRSIDEIDILHNTIGDLQKKLRDKETKLEEICKKYTSLKMNKIKMETDLQSEITLLQEQLSITNKTLSEFQRETEADIEECLSSAVDTHEALFLQEKLRCSKLMYEKVCLNHEIYRLQDMFRRHEVEPKGTDTKRFRGFRSVVDKASSEPLVRRF